MKKSFVALALALSVTPIAALAQENNAPQEPTDAQRQAMYQTFQRFATQEEQLHEQMRSQILAALSPVHRRAVGTMIGELAITPNPDVDAAAKRLDAMLTSYERQRILTAHSAFWSQTKQLHEQMRNEMRSEMPAGHSGFMDRDKQGMTTPQLDAGTILLGVLTPHPHMMMEMHGMHMEGAPPKP
jgi:hypothetical protein